MAAYTPEPQPTRTLPTLQTRRLCLRAFAPSDANRVAELAGTWAIADTTISIPHPYSPECAADWIAGHNAAWTLRRAAHFAVEPTRETHLIGSISLREIDHAHQQAELGFWIAHGVWGQGFATEAVIAVLDFAFDQLRLNRVYAHHMTRNPASGRVLTKAGFRREGLLRERVLKWDRFEDVVLLSVLRKDPRPSSETA